MKMFTFEKKPINKSDKHRKTLIWNGNYNNNAIRNN